MPQALTCPKQAAHAGCCSFPDFRFRLVLSCNESSIRWQSWDKQLPQTVRIGLQVMILTLDKEKGRVSLSTKKLEPTPGDMVRDPNLVYSRADEMAAAFR